MKLCTNCGRHHRGTRCLPVAPRSRSAFLGSLLGLGALGAGCSGTQDPEPAVDAAAVEEALSDDGLTEAPPTSVDPDDILAQPVEPVIPPDMLIIPAYGVAPMPDQPPPPADLETEGSGESEGSEESEDEESDCDGTAEQGPDCEIPILTPQPVYGIPSWREDE